MQLFPQFITLFCKQFWIGLILFSCALSGLNPKENQGHIFKSSKQKVIWPMCPSYRPSEREWNIQVDERKTQNKDRENNRHRQGWKILPSITITYPNSNWLETMISASSTMSFWYKGTKVSLTYWGRVTLEEWFYSLRSSLVNFSISGFIYVQHY